MKVLVTGSAGLVGRYLMPKLREHSMETRGYDKVNSQNLGDETQLKAALKGKDCVIHLAAQLDEHAKDLWYVNVECTAKLLDACTDMGVKRFVHLSTAGVHAGVRGVVSECSPIKPRTPYEKSKAEAEKIVNTYTNKLDITILRPALLIGPNPYWANIFRLVKRRFPIIGDGNNRMQLLYVEDLASAIVLCLEKEESIGQTYIIASEERISLENLYKTIQSVLGIKNDPKRIAVWQAKLLAKMLAVKAKITRTRTIITQEHIERLVRDRLYDTTKISALGWYAKHTIREALKRSAEELKRMGKL